MKNKKLKLDDLKVKSFITEEVAGNSETIKGGNFNFNPSWVDGCRSAMIECFDDTIIGCTLDPICGRTLFRCSWDDGCPTMQLC